MPPRRSKRQIAREQLEDAIRLFLGGHVISSLTLAGAAEEVLSQLAAAEGKPHPLDSVWEAANEIRTRLGAQHISKKEIHRMFNEGRNLVKHHDPGDPVLVRFDDWFDSINMIGRAIFSADNIGLRFSGRRGFHSWLRKRDLM